MSQYLKSCKAGETENIYGDCAIQPYKRPWYNYTLLSSTSLNNAKKLCESSNPGSTCDSCGTLGYVYPACYPGYKSSPIDCDTCVPDVSKVVTQRKDRLANLYDMNEINTNYYNKNDIDNRISSINTTLTSNYYNKTDIDNKITPINTAISDIRTQQGNLNNIISNLNSTYYTKNELTNLLNTEIKKYDDLIRKDMNTYQNSFNTQITTINTNINDLKLQQDKITTLLSNLNNIYYNKTELTSILQTEFKKYDDMIKSKINNDINTVQEQINSLKSALTQYANKIEIISLIEQKYKELLDIFNKSIETQQRDLKAINDRLNLFIEKDVILKIIDDKINILNTLIEQKYVLQSVYKNDLKNLGAFYAQRSM